MTRQAMDWMRELGFRSINMDLIYGLPHQTPETFNETLDTVLDMEPERLAKALGLLWSTDRRLRKKVTWKPRSRPSSVFSQPVTYHHSVR